jgi:hypothetical protein
MKRVLTGAALAVLVAGTGVADTFSVGDLGEMPSRRICMSIAAEVIDNYIDRFGGHSASGNVNDNTSWSYFGWDLRPGEVDVVLTCPIVADQVNAFYTIHAPGDDDAGNADITADRLRDLWTELY